MWFVILLVTATLDASFGFPNLKDPPSNEQTTKLVYRLKERIYEDLLEHFKLSYSRQVDAVRSKRSLLAFQKPSLSGSTGTYSLRWIEQSAVSLCSPALRIKFIDVNGTTYVSCVAVAARNLNASVNLGYLTQYPIKYHYLSSWTIVNPKDLVLFYDQGFIYILVSGNNKDGIDLVKYHVETKKTTLYHTTTGHCPTAISVAKLKFDNTYNLVATSTNCGKENITHEVTTYIWKDNTYFDPYNSFVAYDVKDVVHFHIHGADFIAVANYRRNKSYFADSEILKYNVNKKQWVSHQKIRTYKALDWEFFSIGSGLSEDFFLAVANFAENDRHGKIKSMIFKFVNNIFVPFQCLDVIGATSVASVGDEEKFILAVADMNKIYLYQYDGWRFIRAKISFFQPSISNGIQSLTFHKLVLQRNSFLLAVSSTDQRHINEETLFELKFEEENYIQSWYENVTEWCFDKLADLHTTNVEDSIELQQLLFIDQKDPIIMHGNVKFDAGIEASALSTSSLILNDVNYNSGFLGKLNELKNRLQVMKNGIEMIEDLLSRTMKANENQDIYAFFQFRDGRFPCDRGSCQFTNLMAEELNGDDVADLNRNIIFIDHQTFIGTIHAISITVSNITINGKFDGVDIESIVTKTGNQLIDGYKVFRKSLHANTVTVDGLLDMVNFTRQEIFLLGSDQDITGVFTFGQIKVTWLEVAEYLNTVHLINFFDDAVLLSAIANITGEKTFIDILTSELRVSSGSSINEVDLPYLWSRVFWKTGSQEIKTNMQFHSISFESDLQVDGLINGIFIPGPRILLTNRDTVITAPQTFEQIADINNLFVKNINTISIGLESGELDILKIKGSQVITGNKIMKTIVLDNHSYVQGSVDGIDLKFLNSVANSFNMISDDPWTFNYVIAEDDVKVEGKISSYNLHEIYDNALKISDIPYLNNFIFEAPISVEEMHSYDIDRINITRDFVRAGGFQIIRGVKTFQDILLQDDSQVVGLLNKIDSSFLQNSILRKGNQVITANKAFKGNLRLNDLTVRGYVNNINFNEIVTLHSETLFEAKIIHSSTFGDLFVDRMTAFGMVNEVNINQMMEDTMTYGDEQTVFGRKSVTGELVFENNANLVTKDFNNVDLGELFMDAVLTFKDQFIEGKKIFTSPVSFESVIVHGSIDGVFRLDFNNWLLQSTVQSVEGPVIFGNVIAEYMFVNTKINELDIVKLNDSIIYADDLAIIDGHVSFNGTVISKGNIFVTGAVQNIDLSEELSMPDNDIITGRKTFASDLFIHELTVESSLDNTDISRLCSSLVLLHDEQTIKSLTITGDVTFENDGILDGTISGIDISSLYENALSQNEEIFDGLKSFQSLTIEGNFIVLKQLNGVNLALLAEKYMSIGKTQRLMGHQFEEIYMHGNMFAENLYTTEGKVGSLDITHLTENAMLTSGQQTITAEQRYSSITFEDDVVVVGKISGVEIPRGLMRKSRTNYIRGRKVFTEPVHILGRLDLEDGKSIEGIDISSWLTVAVRKKGSSYRIGGNKVFLDAAINDMRLHGLIDNLEVSEDSLLLTYGNQLITKVKTINNLSTYHELKVRGGINDVNMEDLKNNAINKGNSTITAVKTFLAPLNVKFLQAEQIDGVHIEDMLSLIHGSVNYNSSQYKLQEIEKISDISFLSQRNSVSLYYEMIQALDIAGCGALYLRIPNSEFLIISEYEVSKDVCAGIRIFKYSAQTERFEIKENLLSSSIAAVRDLKAWNNTFVVIGNGESSSSCSRKYSIGASVTNLIYFYDTSGQRFSKYQEFMTSPLSDVVTFSDKSRAHIVAVGISEVILFSAKDMFHNFIFREKLSTPGGKKASIIGNKNNTILTIASISADSDPNEFVDVYFWNGKTFGFPTTLKAMKIKDVLLLSLKSSLKNEVFLIVAEDSVSRINDAQRLVIYKLHGNNLYKYQEIRDCGKLDWVLSETGEVLLFVLDETSNINIYVHKGVSGFIRKDSIRAVGASGLHIFNRNDGGWNDYIAIFGHNRKRKGIQQVKLLASKKKGGTGIYT